MTDQIYALKATLLEIEPPDWRRLHVAESLTLYSLHRVLQIAFGGRTATCTCLRSTT